MSQTASFLTDFLFPGLLIACGCLGLGVVNGIGNGHRAPRPAAAPIRPAPRTVQHRLNFGEGQTRVTDAERKRLEDRISKAEDQLSGVRRKLANESFVERAPAEVVQRERDREAEVAGQIEMWRQNLKDLL